MVSVPTVLNTSCSLLITGISASITNLVASKLTDKVLQIKMIDCKHCISLYRKSRVEQRVLRKINGNSRENKLEPVNFKYRWKLGIIKSVREHEYDLQFGISNFMFILWYFSIYYISSQQTKYFLTK